MMTQKHKNHKNINHEIKEVGLMGTSFNDNKKYREDEYQEHEHHRRSKIDDREFWRIK